MIKKALPAAAMIAVLLFSGCGAEGGVLASVNGHRITEREFTLKSGLYSLDITGEDAARRFLNLLISDYVIIEQAKKDRMKVTRAELESEIKSFVPHFSEKEIKKSLKKKGIRYGYWLRDMEEKIIRKKEINFAMRERIKIEDGDLKDFFWSNILEFRRVRKVRARQIVLDSEEKAKETVKLAREGADFAELAKKYSVTSEAEEGGDLGYFSPKDMPGFINDAVAGLKPGAISTIVKSPYGWHIFKVEDTAPAVTPKFEEVRAEVLELYLDMKKDEYFGVWMEEIRKKMDIKVNEENLKKFVMEELS